MIEKIDINEVENNLPSKLPSKIRALDSTNKSIVSSVRDLMDTQSISGGWVQTEKGMSKCSFKNLGDKAGDGVASVMLIAKQNSTPSYYSGAFGRIYLMRGHTTAMFTCHIIDFICVQAHSSTKFYGRYIDGANIKIGSCTYMGERYIAVQLGSSPAYNIFLDGIYTNNCVFTQVLESSVTWE